MIAIIGGGYAGLAAAVSLVERGLPVTLFEAGKTLGGRARGVDYRGTRLDNGQHLMLGAYRETLRLMTLVGTPDKALQRKPLSLTVPGQFSLAPPALPAPLHLAIGLLMAQGLPWRERFGALRFALAMRFAGFRLDTDVSVATLLARYGQQGKICRLLWEPLCLSALNTPIAKASAQVFLNVLRDSFSHARNDSDMLLPQVDLTTLFPDSAARFVQNGGGVAQTATRVKRVEKTPAGFELSWDEGSQVFSHLICATAPQHALKIMDNLPGLEAEKSLLTALEYQPIATIYLQYPSQTRLPEAMLGLSGGMGQWVFDRGQTHGTEGLLAVVISAEGPYQDWPPEQLATVIAGELREIFDLPAPRWHKVIMERRATFACTPGIKRPAQLTHLDNFLLAGDYTAGDYPATIEGAVRSGIRCAGLIQ
ncbi:MAG: hydroxysqualene dehydroxylase HpnE [Sulfuricellaceae bacterium]|nr:hydroxysqualene dehydroxylase HpnE [Sulfuricellaceae bacterium]